MCIVDTSIAAHVSFNDRVVREGEATFCRTLGLTAPSLRPSAAVAFNCTMPSNGTTLPSLNHVPTINPLESVQDICQQL